MEVGEGILPDNFTSKKVRVGIVCQKRVENGILTSGSQNEWESKIIIEWEYLAKKSRNVNKSLKNRRSGPLVPPYTPLLYTHLMYRCWNRLLVYFSVKQTYTSYVVDIV